MTHNRTTHARLLAALGLGSTLMFSAGQVLAANGHAQGQEYNHGHAIAASTPASVRKAAIALTEDFVIQHKRWAQAQGASNKARARQALIAKAEARHALLTELVQSSPAEVLRVAIPAEQQLGLPSEVLDLLEQPLEVEGELETIYEDHADGSHKLRHFINTPFGERFEVHLAAAELKQPSGAKVRASGLLITGGKDRFNSDGHLALDNQDENLVTLAADGTSSSVAELLPALPNTFGEQKTAVILVNFQDDTREPWTEDQVRNVVFGQASNFFAENSFQQTWLSGEVLGWYTLPMSKSGCDYKTIAASALEEAQARGVNLSGYNRRIFAFPFNSACGWAGLGSVGGSPSSAWINGYMDLRTVSHELGHNLGLYHSHALECGNAISGSNCSTLEYGDATDVMGKATAHFNAFQKELLGWLDNSHITTVSSGGSFNLETYAAPTGNAPKALKVLKETDPATGKKTWYYVEFRRPTGFDSSLANFMNTGDGVVIHTGSEASRNTSFLLDMTPGSSIADWDDPTLVVGQAYADEGAGIAIASNWANSSSASVTVDLAPQSCTEAPPTISATPLQSDWLVAGSSFSYSLKVTNRNSASCGSTTYGLSANRPSGWSAAFSSSSLTLTPGESRTISLNVTSPGAATDGFYSIGVQATDGRLTGQVGLTYVVNNPTSNSAPVAINDSATLTSVEAVTIAVLNNDSDPEGDALSISSVTQGAKGSVRINNDGTLTYLPGKRFKNSDSFTYTITDGAKSATASVSIQLQSSSGNASGIGGGKGNGKHH